MKAYLYNGRVVFLPLKGATEIPEANVIEETDGPLGANEEVGAVDSVTLEPDGKVRIRRLRKPKSKKTKAKEDIAAAGNVAQLRKAILDYVAE